MPNSGTIAQNTLFLYFRMILKLGIELYTSRVVLDILGVQDYGIYSVVGGVIALLGFFNSAMVSATQRFLSIDIGRNDTEQLNNTFNAALLIHAGIAILVFILAETVGLWFINNKLNIPESRIVATHWVYQFTILTFIVSVLRVPYDSLTMARERMNIYAFIGIIEVVLRLLALYLLVLFSVDKLALYAFLLLLISVLVATVSVSYCRLNFKESRVKRYYNKDYFKALVSYSGWNLIGNMAAVVKGHGINILLNIFLGTIVNAAYGITLQVQGAVSSFVYNFQMALDPQIYKSYARDDIAQMRNLMFQGAKFSFFLTLVIVCPILYNVDFVLELWLKKVPEYTSSFVALTLVNILIECISRPLIAGALATGQIKRYQIIVGGILFLNLPISYVLLYTNLGVASFLYVALCISLVTLLFRLHFLRKMLDLDILLFFKEVGVPILKVSMLGMLLVYFLNTTIGKANNFMMLAGVAIVDVVILLIVIFLVGLKKTEKEILYKLAKCKY